ITVHMDAGNSVFRVLGDESYHIAAPTNLMMLSPSEAAVAAGRALGVNVSPVLVEADAQRAVFTSAVTLDPIRVDRAIVHVAQGAVFPPAVTLDPIRVERAIVHVAQGDDRFAYETLVSWLADQRQQQYQLVLIDALDGSMLASYSLVNTFTGRVFNVNAQATANMTTDTRTVVSFDGDPPASPSGWVGTARNTVGHNAGACTDLDAHNARGPPARQPTA